MTNSEQNKAKHEAAVLAQFLKNLNLTYADPGESSPHHDGWALKDGRRIAALELTRYVVDGGRCGGSRQLSSVSLWDKNIWPLVNTERRQLPELQHIMASIEFSSTLPPRKHKAEDLATQIVKITAKAWAERNAQELLPDRMQSEQEPVTSVFIEDRSGCTSNFQEFGTAYINPDPILFPLVSKHVQQIHITEWPNEWPEWWGPDMRGGAIHYCPASLCRILEDKTQKLQKRKSTNEPVWLVILCDLFNDVQTHIYPRLHDANSLKTVESMFDLCEYDFTKCPFAQIWLMSQVSGHSMMMVPHRLSSSMTILQPNK